MGGLSLQDTVGLAALARIGGRLSQGDANDLTRLAWDAFPTAAYVCDRDGLIVSYNKKAVELWGRAPAIGDPAERFCGSYRLYGLDGGLIPHHECYMAQVLRTGISVRDEEILVERPDGTRAIAMVNIEPIRDERGEVTGAINCFHDVTTRKQQERDLQRICEELEDYFDNASVGMHIVDADGVVVRVNRAQLELLGYGQEEYLGRHVSEFHADANRSQEILARLREGETIDKLPVTLRAKDGAIKHVLLNSNGRFQEGKFTGARTVFLDVTAQHRAEQERKEGEQRLHSILNLLPAAIYLTDAEGRITYYNEAAAELWGHRPELGTSEWCGSWKLYWPDGTPLPHDQCPMAMTLKEQRPVRGMEAIAERPDGTRVPFIPFPTPIFDATGRLIGAINMLVDITHRKETEGVLKRQAHDLASLTVENAALLRTAEAEMEQRRKATIMSQRLAAIVESSDDAILWKDINGVIQSWNKGAQRLFGYTTDEVIGKPVTILIPPDRQDEEPSILARIRRGERVDHYETVRRRKDGSLIDISLSVSPVKDENGRIIGAAKIARNITERRRAEQQQHLLLREMNHRVKNLMTLAASLVTLSARSAKTPAELAAAVRERLAALARAHELTLPRTSETEAAEHGTTLHALIRAIVSPYDPDQSRVMVSGDNLPIGPRAATSMALLLHELTTNAAKYGALSTTDGRIHVDCARTEEQCVLIWTETGGPRVVPSTSEGFGTLLSRSTVQHALAGDIVRAWKPEGLSVKLSVDCRRLTA